MKEGKRSIDVNKDAECVECGKRITILVKTHWGICNECAIKLEKKLKKAREVTGSKFKGGKTKER